MLTFGASCTGGHGSDVDDGNTDSAADPIQCAVDNGGCDPATTCTEIDGGVACGDCPTAHVGDGVSGCEFDEDLVVDMVLSYTETGFERINTTPFTQQLGPEVPRNVWVSKSPTEAASLYAAIDPLDLDFESDAPFPIGTVIIHAVPHDELDNLVGCDAVDQVRARGVLVKVAPGFGDTTGTNDPTRNDWWWGSVLPNGQIFASGANSETTGTIDTDDPCHVEAEPYMNSCIGCHTRDRRSPRTDMLWGVPRNAI